MTHAALALDSDGERSSLWKKKKLVVHPIQDYTLLPLTLTPLISLGTGTEVI